MSHGQMRAAELAAEAGASYEKIKRDCESKVVRWEWATFERYSYEPAHFEIDKAVPGKPLPAEPEPPVDGSCGYGFDLRDRVVVERQQTEFPGRAYETFYRHETGGIAQFHYSYDPEKSWINVAWLEIGPPGVVAAHAIYRSGWRSTSFGYDAAGRLVGCENRGANQISGDVHDFRDIEYDTAGAIARVYWRKPDGSRTLHFERPAPTDTLRARRKFLLGALADAVVAALDAEKIDEPVYALAVQRSAELYEYRLPPAVAVARQRERLRFLEEQGKEAPDYIWNPAEWESSEIDLRLDDELARLCATVSQDIWQNELNDEVDELLAELAEVLGKRRLPLERTTDFVSLVLDHDADPHQEQVAAQIDARTARSLRAAKFL